MNQAAWLPWFQSHPYAGTLEGANTFCGQKTLRDPESVVHWYLRFEHQRIDGIAYQVKAAPIAMATCHWCADFYHQHPTPPYHDLTTLSALCQRVLGVDDHALHHCLWILDAWLKVLDSAYKKT